MKKEMRQLGGSKGITFSPEECRIYGGEETPLEVGDIVQVELFRVRTREDKVKLWEANHATGALFADPGSEPK